MCERINSWQSATTAVEPGQVDHPVAADQGRHVQVTVAEAVAVAARLQADQVDQRVVAQVAHAPRVDQSLTGPRIAHLVIAEAQVRAVPIVVMIVTIVRAVVLRVQVVMTAHQAVIAMIDLALLVHAVLHHVRDLRTDVMIALVAVLSVVVVMTAHQAVIVMIVLVAVLRVVMSVMIVLVAVLRVVVVMTVLRVVMSVMIGLVAVLRVVVVMTVLRVVIVRQVAIAAMSEAVQMVSAAIIATLLGVQAITVVMIVAPANR